MGSTQALTKSPLQFTHHGQNSEIQNPLEEKWAPAR
jgi:hypothetical protein